MHLSNELSRGTPIPSQGNWNGMKHILGNVVSIESRRSASLSSGMPHHYPLTKDTDHGSGLHLSRYQGATFFYLLLPGLNSHQDEGEPSASAATVTDCWRQSLPESVKSQVTSMRAPWESIPF